MIDSFRILSIHLMILALWVAQNGEFPNELKNWYVAQPPMLGSEKLCVASLSLQNWFVNPSSAGVQVRKFESRQNYDTPLPFKISPRSYKEGLDGQLRAVKVNDGWIVSFNGGEFGAGLWWFSPDGKQRYKISNHHRWFVSLVSTASGLFGVEVFELGGHDPSSSVVHFQQNTKGQWQTELVCKLGDQSYAAAQDTEGSLIVVTSQRLVKVILDSKKTLTLLDKMFWEELYPNSMVITPSGDIFIGMRQGVAKIEKKGQSRQISWLVPNKKVLDEKWKPGFK